MIRYNKILVFFIIMLSFSGLFAQKVIVKKKVMTVKTSPDMTLQFNFNYNQAMLQLSGAFNDDFQSEQFVNGINYGADKGIGGGFIFKIPLHNWGNIRLNISGNYNRLQSYLFPKKGVADVGESNFNFYTLGTGLENNFTPNHKIKLYVGVELLLSVINGNATVWVENKPGTPYTYDVKYKNGFRIGGGVTAGAEFLVSNRVGLNLGFKFSWLNALFKEAKFSDDPGESYLNDDSGDPAIPFQGKKQIGFISISTGVSFYFGIFEKKYVIRVPK